MVHARTAGCARGVAPDCRPDGPIATALLRERTSSPMNVPSELPVSVAAAAALRSAGLRYVHSNEPGTRRARAGGDSAIANRRVA